MEVRKRHFPTFVLWLLVFAVSLLFLLVRCSSEVFIKGPPALSAAAEGVPVNWVMAPNVWNGQVREPEDLFLRYGREIGIPAQTAAGEAITIKLDGDVPDRAVLVEYALSPDRKSAFGGQQLLSEYPFYFDRRTGTITLPEPGEHPVRGYMLRCYWGENNCDYGMVVQILLE